MVLQVGASALRVAECVDYPNCDNRVLHGLVHLSFQILGGMRVVTNGRGDIYQFLRHRPSQLCSSSTKGTRANLMQLLDRGVSLGWFLSKLTLVELFADLHTALDVGAA
jgi:hypothetical protein